ncbi:MAG TPA: radical SAM protein [Bryobacteraceae bacterium]|jgi:radical SAM protein with 4Fe4S-binding SPASM domain|nr:radical SAM protein [Bryobacteraceae bacterium]
MIAERYSVPHFLQFETTYGCNSHCVFCYNPSREQHYSSDLTWRVIRAIADAQVPLVQLTGGEVTMLKELNDYADHLGGRSKVSIVTNGIRRVELTPAIRKVFVSMHGSRETHERITANPGTFDTIVSNIEYYVSTGVRVAADVVLSADNYGDIYAIIRKASELGMAEVYINRFQGGGFGAAVINKLMPPIALFREALGRMIAARRDFGIPVVFGTSIPLCIDERLVLEGFEFNCGMGVKFAAIAPDGELRACNQALKGYGNVTRTPLETIWQSDALDDYRDHRWVTGICKGCALLDRCGGGCRVDNSQIGDYCPDSFVRHLEKRPDTVERILEAESAMPARPQVPASPHTGKRRLRAERNLIVIRKHKEKYLVRDDYSAAVVDDVAADLCEGAGSGSVEEMDLWAACARRNSGVSAALLGRYVDHLVATGVLYEC